MTQVAFIEKLWFGLSAQNARALIPPIHHALTAQPL